MDQISSAGINNIGAVAPVRVAAEKVSNATREPTQRSQLDQVSLSDDAKRLSQLAQSAAGSPDVDEAKVEWLKLQIENGTYGIDPRNIAQQLIRQEQELS